MAKSCPGKAARAMSGLARPARTLSAAIPGVSRKSGWPSGSTRVEFGDRGRAVQDRVLVPRNRLHRPREGSTRDRKSTRHARCRSRIEMTTEGSDRLGPRGQRGLPSRRLRPDPLGGLDGAAALRHLPARRGQAGRGAPESGLPAGPGRAAKPRATSHAERLTSPDCASTAHFRQTSSMAMSPVKLVPRT